MRAVLLVMVVLGVGCVESSTTRCGALTCPADSVCVEAGGCVPSVQAAGCNSVADGASCSYPGVDDGACRMGFCVPATCGNGFVDDGEACDDGDLVATNDCSLDCSSTNECGNGVVDELLGEACDDGNLDDGDGCLATCQLSRCGDGVIDTQYGEVCDAGTANSQAADAPCRENCQPRRCGDGVVDSVEVCDDGNVSSGDGCTFDCLSLETCGNNIVDLAAGEDCDDANARSHDGCASTCASELLTWTRTQQRVPTNLYRTALAYDAARGRVVAFGGGLSNGFSGYSNETWEWDGRSWLLRKPLSSPAGRFGHKLAYDSRRQRVVLFGGRGAVPFSDTWEWDGAEWIQRTPQDSPSPRAGYAMAYDKGRGVTVLHGGEPAANQAINDHWEWDGENWVKSAAVVPNPGNQNYTNHSMTYDEARGNLVLVVYSKTFTFDGTAWTQRNFNATFGGDYADIAYDRDRQVVVIHGGFSVGSDVWEWNGTSWAKRVLATAPSGQYGHGIAYDAARGALVRFGGFGDYSYETWVLDASDWKNTIPAPMPSVRYVHEMANDVRRGVTVLFGGLGSGGVRLADTWEFDGSTWIQKTTSSTPLARGEHRMAYDAKRGATVMFGGLGDPGGGVVARQDTWEYDGTNWVDKTPGSGNPSARLAPTMAYDVAHGVVMLFGGGAYPGTTVLGDTWLWNGSTWSLVSPTTSPDPRKYAASAYDADRGRVVMFGGVLATGATTNETWEWDGTNWEKKLPAVSPPPGTNAQDRTMTYDALRGVSVLYVQTQGSIWEWNGVNWKVRSPQKTAPQPLFGGEIVYHSVLHGSVVFGSDPSVPSNTNAETFLLRTDAGAVEESCRYGFDADLDGALGCADPDCDGACDPLCATLNWCDQTQPRCGDTTCGPLETCHLCPMDCGACP